MDIIKGQGDLRCWTIIDTWAEPFLVGTRGRKARSTQNGLNLDYYVTLVMLVLCAKESQ